MHVMNDKADIATVILFFSRVPMKRLKQSTLRNVPAIVCNTH